MKAGFPNVTCSAGPPFCSTSWGASWLLQAARCMHRKLFFYGVDKDGQCYAVSGPSARGPGSPHPHLTQPSPWRPFLSLLFPSASSREIASHSTAGRCARGHRQPHCYRLGQDAGPPHFRKGGQRMQLGDQEVPTAWVPTAWVG